MACNRTILDCYTDEPAGLGVPPFVGVWPRYVAGQFEREPTYLTVDDIRLLRYVEHVPNVHGLHQTIGMVSCMFGYTVDPHDDGATLSIEIEYSVPVPVLGKLAERVLLRRNAREFEVGIVTIKDVLEH